MNELRKLNQQERDYVRRLIQKRNRLKEQHGKAPDWIYAELSAYAQIDFKAVKEIIEKYS